MFRVGLWVLSLEWIPVILVTVVLVLACWIRDLVHYTGQKLFSRRSNGI